MSLFTFKVQSSRTTKPAVNRWELLTEDFAPKIQVKSWTELREVQVSGHSGVSVLGFFNVIANIGEMPATSSIYLTNAAKLYAAVLTFEQRVVHAFTTWRTHLSISMSSLRSMSSLMSDAETRLFKLRDFGHRKRDEGNYIGPRPCLLAWYTWFELF